MTPDPHAALLERCARADASAADLQALEALLARQEREAGWASIAALLRGSVADGAPELADPVIAAVAPGAEGHLPAALADLRVGLARAAEGVDVSREVLEAVAPATLLDHAVAALTSGLDTAARRLDLADAVLADLGAPARGDAAGLVAAALRSEAGEVPLVADAVMERLAVEDAAPMEAMALADGAIDPARRQAVAQRLAADPGALHAASALVALGRDLRAAVRSEAGTPPEAWPAVARALGFEREIAFSEAMAGLGDALRGRSPDLADAVMAAVQPRPVAVAVPAPARRRSAWIPGLAMLAAAAAAGLLVLNVVRAPSVGEQQEVASSLSSEPPIVLAALNDTRIDDLQVDPGSMVQLLQFEDGAPMIIYVDEGSVNAPSGEVVL